MSTLTNPSLLLLRNEEVLTAKSILVVNFVQDGFLRELKALNPDAQICAFSYNLANGEFAGNVSGIDVEVAPQLPQGQFDLVICYYPKSKPEALMTFDNIRAICNESTRLLVVGENKGGVKSAEKQLKQLAGYASKLDSARHCLLYLFEDLKPNTAFNLDNYLKQFTIADGEQSIKIQSLPGVFNHGSLDDGTALLLEHIPLLGKGKALDFGCGAGIIAAVLASRNPELEFECIDVSALAVYSTNKTFESNNIRGTSYLSDGLGKVQGQFNAIVSNPPFHTGIATDYSIAEGFIRGAKSHLKKKGQLFIVANSFLKYPQILAENFQTNETVTKNKRFALYRSA